MNFFWSKKKLIEAHEKELADARSRCAEATQQYNKLIREIQTLLIDNSRIDDDLERFSASEKTNKKE